MTTIDIDVLILYTLNADRLREVSARREVLVVYENVLEKDDRLPLAVIVPYELFMAQQLSLNRVREHLTIAAESILQSPPKEL